MPDITPTGGEIGCHEGFRLSPRLKDEARSAKLLISPQVGEMSGRTGGRCPASVRKDSMQ
ncbi:hypothetical protein EN858_16710 [Mesorhizobium sp. M4B.F.Ca.ET.215.01.1.1]|nr:hypothetical protein EOA34_01195 [Mesorhizobium sp. M4B.F.Ca.ET.013.02.1.1]RVD38378.1 hypothetical protein EN741_21265 [Mesorhizobium sp. M4B.F.Ca.ET.019.03.1.1]RWF64539.1 MAG: hypothetical protein EOS47_14495 [Mesorhizobium sp.]TGQ10810.1 hypothetical protein EN858_16710 [Mesorhizobium sp. M4B.F.Ca.ET.215.01.1.1]TGQ36390.1 hypothetical protein EN857_17855 [Mesorhizobium sp. M4B.F.Ca.ET.214.01.1.1]TGQ38315.1 hypothetical protein EN863_026880 [Mesorhizobium sp. M00.F.Ca.ET.220.01.1.1]TGQ591